MLSHETRTTSESLSIVGRAGHWRPVLPGLLIHVGCGLLACLITPIVMGSNIWPIAAAFWGVIIIPVGALTGALIGWLVKGWRRPPALAALMMSGVILAFAAGMLIAATR
jgi:hypothetical protein